MRRPGIFPRPIFSSSWTEGSLPPKARTIARGRAAWCRTTRRRSRDRHLGIGPAKHAHAGVYRRRQGLPVKTEGRKRCWTSSAFRTSSVTTAISPPVARSSRWISTHGPCFISKTSVTECMMPTTSLCVGTWPANCRVTRKQCRLEIAPGRQGHEQRRCSSGPRLGRAVREEPCGESSAGDAALSPPCPTRGSLSIDHGNTSGPSRWVTRARRTTRVSC